MILEGNNQNLTKLLIKIFDAKNNASKWIHLCYIPEVLYEKYKAEKPEDAKNINATLSRWAKKDFEQELIIETSEDLDILRQLIKEFCKRVYPDIYLEQSTDRQGWLRVWITRKIKEELELGE